MISGAWPRTVISCAPWAPVLVLMALALSKTDASPHLSRELLIRAVAYRMQEIALAGLRPERQRQLRQIAQELKQTGAAAKRFRPQLKPGARLMREWQGRTYEVVVLDAGSSWQGTQYRSLFRDRENDHRHGVVRAAVLRAETKPIGNPPDVAGIGTRLRTYGGERCRG
jgi:Protein of unknown function (DUF2924)